MNPTQDPENMNSRRTHCRPDSAAPHSSPRARHARGLGLAAIFALIILMPGCKPKTPKDRPANPDSQSSQSVTATGTISADPNPVPAGTGKGKTKINWSVSDGTGQVYLSIDGGKEDLFSGHSGAEAPWIEEGHDYEFRLYAGEEHKTVLGSVKVTRSKQ